MIKYMLALLSLFAAPIPSAHAQTLTSASYIAQNPETELSEQKIYFFAHALCQNCKTAYTFITTAYQNLPLPISDMKEPHNLDLYKQCVKKFQIPNKDLTLPLICMGNHYILGWDNTAPKIFETHYQKFKEETK